MNYTRIRLLVTGRQSCPYSALRPLVEGGGFEPPKAEPADLQSAPFDRSGTPPEYRLSVQARLNPVTACRYRYPPTQGKTFAVGCLPAGVWSPKRDSNPRPADSYPYHFRDRIEAPIPRLRRVWSLDFLFTLVHRQNQRHTLGGRCKVSTLPFRPARVTGDGRQGSTGLPFCRGALHNSSVKTKRLKQNADNKIRFPRFSRLHSTSFPMKVQFSTNQLL